MEKWDVLLLCAICIAVLFSLFDSGQISIEEKWLVPIDTQYYLNGHFPQETELLPSPLITDLDGDGLNEVVMALPNYKLLILDASDKLITKAEATLLPTVKIAAGRKPIVISSGYLGETKIGEANQQVVIVITNGWTVLCFNHKLKLLWESNVQDFISTESFHREIAAIVISKALRVGDKGAVIVGGRIVSASNKLGLDHSHEKDSNTNSENIAHEETEEYQHFSYYAFDGRTGALVWKHEYGDFYQDDKHQNEDEALMPDHSFKLHVLGKSNKHIGEMNWRNFKPYMLQQLPHKWRLRSDTKFFLKHFEKQRHIGVGAQLILQEGKELDTIKPNVLVAHLRDGIEVIHLYTGRTLTRLQFQPNGLFDDINADGIIDHVFSSPKDNDLFGIATSGVPLGSEILFNGSLTADHSSGFSSLLSGINELDVNKRKRIEAANPLTIARGSETSCIFLISSGRITNFNSNGKVNWQMDTSAEWEPSQLFPSLEQLPVGQENYILAVARDLAIISEKSYVISSQRIAGTPVAPPIIGDFNNDGQSDIILITSTGFYGYGVLVHVGYSIFQIFVLIFLIALIAVLVLLFVDTKDGKKQ